MKSLHWALVCSGNWVELVKLWEKSLAFQRVNTRASSFYFSRFARKEGAKFQTVSSHHFDQVRRRFQIGPRNWNQVHWRSKHRTENMNPSTVILCGSLGVFEPKFCLVKHASTDPRDGHKSTFSHSKRCVQGVRVSSCLLILTFSAKNLVKWVHYRSNGWEPFSTFPLRITNQRDGCSQTRFKEFKIRFLRSCSNPAFQIFSTSNDEVLLGMETYFPFDIH